MLLASKHSHNGKGGTDIEPMKQETITVKVSKRNRLGGTRYAKKFGGKFDPKTQTWEIPANRPEIPDLEAYYLVQVEKPLPPEDIDIDEQTSW